MQPREKLLAGVVGSLIGLLVVYWLFGNVRKSFTDRWNQIEVLEGEINQRLAQEARGKKAAEQLAHWEHRSLSSDVDLARTLYKNELLELAAKTKLDPVSIDPGKGGPHQKIYYKLPFTVQCKGTLEQAVSFLYGFYGKNHLDQLREMSIKPSSGSSSGKLDLSFTIEALVLPGADRNDALNDESGNRLTHTKLASYTEPIVKRNLFAEYTPPKPPAPKIAEIPETKPPVFDPSKFAFLTGVVQVGDETEAWFHLRTTGERLILREGDELKVGPFKGKITRIDGNGVEVETGGKRRMLTLGKNLAQATESGKEEEKKASDDAPSDPAH